MQKINTQIFARSSTRTSKIVLNGPNVNKLAHNTKGTSILSRIKLNVTYSNLQLLCGIYPDLNKLRNSQTKIAKKINIFAKITLLKSKNCTFKTQKLYF